MGISTQQIEEQTQHPESAYPKGESQEVDLHVGDTATSLRTENFSYCHYTYFENGELKLEDMMVEIPENLKHVA